MVLIYLSVDCFVGVVGMAYINVRTWLIYSLKSEIDESFISRMNA